jgi:hypothetical protein
VLHQQPPETSGIKLIFQCWRRHAGALFAPLRYKVFLSITNIYALVWSEEIVQEIPGSSCKVFESSHASIEGSDLSSYLVVAWTQHPDLILTKVGCIVPADEPFIVGQRSLFLGVEEIIRW